MDKYEEDKTERITNWIIGLGIMMGCIWLFAEYDFVELFGNLKQLFIGE